MGNPKLQFIPQYTYEDYAQWEGRWELIKGIPVAMSPLPAMKHQRINGLIHRVLLEQLAKCPLCEAFIPIDWKVDEETVLQPDNLVVCHPLETISLRLLLSFLRFYPQL